MLLHLLRHHIYSQLKIISNLTWQQRPTTNRKNNFIFSIFIQCFENIRKIKSAKIMFCNVELAPYIRSVHVHKLLQKRVFKVKPSSPCGLLVFRWVHGSVTSQSRCSLIGCGRWKALLHVHVCKGLCSK